MLCSLDKEERLFAIYMIFSIRGENEMGDTSVRFRVLPMLNIMATKLKDLICWDNAMEPVVTASLSKPQLEQYREEPMLVKYYCCHTQGIERAVKEVILITFLLHFPHFPKYSGNCCLLCSVWCRQTRWVHPWEGSAQGAGSQVE